MDSIIFSSILQNFLSLFIWRSPGVKAGVVGYLQRHQVLSLHFHVAGIPGASARRNEAWRSGKLRDQYYRWRCCRFCCSGSEGCYDVDKEIADATLSTPGSGLPKGSFTPHHTRNQALQLNHQNQASIKFAVKPSRPVIYIRASGQHNSNYYGSRRY